MERRRRSSSGSEGSSFLYEDDLADLDSDPDYVEESDEEWSKEHSKRGALARGVGGTGGGGGTGRGRGGRGRKGYFPTVPLAQAFNQQQPGMGGMQPGMGNMQPGMGVMQPGMLPVQQPYMHGHPGAHYSPMARGGVRFSSPAQYGVAQQGYVQQGGYSSLPPNPLQTPFDQIEWDFMLQQPFRILHL